MNTFRQRLVLLLLQAFLLTGCALTREQLGQMSSADLCVSTINKPMNIHREEWRGELSRRGENCSAYVGLAQAHANAEAANTAAMMNAVNLMNSGANAANAAARANAQQNQTTNCLTQHVGNGQYRTTCR